MKFIKTILKDLLTKPYEEKKIPSWKREIVWFGLVTCFINFIIGFILGCIMTGFLNKVF